MTKRQEIDPLKALVAICDEIFEMWDKDQRPGKLLSALAGRISRYRADVDLVRQSLAWQPMEAAPKDGTYVLLWWPGYKLNDDGDLSDEVDGGTQVIGNFSGGSWQEIGGLDGIGDWYGDDWEYGHEPLFWAPLLPNPHGAKKSEKVAA